MKKHLFVTALLMALGMSLAAQEQQIANYSMALGVGPEWNMNSEKNFAGGLSLGFDYDLPIPAIPFAAGLFLSGSSNFSSSGVIEGAGLFRWYFLNLNSNQRFAGFFAQAELGAFIIMEDKETIPLFLGGVRTGYRFPLKRFFVEPFGRIGYPFAFGIGVMGGVKIGNKE